MATGETANSTMKVERGEFLEQFGVVTVIKLAEDIRDRIAEDEAKGKVFEPGEVDVNRELLKIYRGWLSDAGVELLPHQPEITADVLKGGDAEVALDYSPAHAEPRPIAA